MNTFQTNYQALLGDENDAPNESIIFHITAEANKSRWNHVDDLDSFFRRVYNYHQKQGFWCIIIERFLELVKFIAIIFGFFYIMHCVHFNFDEHLLYSNSTELHFGELLIPLDVCAARFSLAHWLLIILGMLITLQKVYKFIVSTYHYREIEQFYTNAMKITNSELDNITWHEVQCRLREVQHEQQMCVHKSDLTELDIYHRILRQTNYMIALVNKNILPIKFNLKFFGEWVYFSEGLNFNLKHILFGSSFSPFDNKGSLREEYKKYSKRKELAARLSKYITFALALNIFMALPIALFDIVNQFVQYSGFVRIKPWLLGTRQWSQYSRLYLRHFNELDHELEARLNRAYKPAKEYVSSFSSPLLASFAKFLAHIFGTLTTLLALWGIFKEPLFQIQYVLLFVASGSIIIMAAHSLIPDENAVFHPASLMRKIIADIHYAPDHWISNAHTNAVRKEFTQLFLFKSTHIFEDLFSFIITPIILFKLRDRALDIVDFFRNFTVQVAGVGDVCSFALMDVSKHGNQNWFHDAAVNADQYKQAEDGKTELSVLHFKLMNPHWKPPPSSSLFMENFKQQVNSERLHPGTLQQNPLYSSLNSLSTLGSKYAALVSGYYQQSKRTPEPSFTIPPISLPNLKNTDIMTERIAMRGGINRAEGPPYLVQEGTFCSLNENINDVFGGAIPSLQQDDITPMDIRAADMSLNALYLHEIRRQHAQLPRASSELRLQVEPPEDEVSPLLRVP